ncbi:MAG: mechanosensitive ion channel domain-containing protein [Burkholderiales bacterium]
MLRNLKRIAAVALVLAGVALPASAAEEAREATAEKFAVKLGDRVVLYVRQGIRAFTAAERADRLSQKLRQLADDPSIAPFKVTVDETGVSSDLLVGPEVLVSVFDTDARDFAGKTRHDVAVEGARLIEEAVAQYREERAPESLAIDAAKAAAGLLAAIVFLFLFQRVFRKARQFVLERAGRELEKVESKTGRMIRVEQLRWPLLVLLRAVQAMVWITVSYGAVSIALSFFPHTRTVAREIDELVLAPLAELGIEILKGLPGLIVVVVIALAARWAIRGNRYLFTQIERKRIEIQGFYPEWARPTQRLVTVVLLIVAVIMAYPYVPGSGSPAFQGIAIFLGLLGSLGATGVVSNLINGLIITYMRSFHVGDLVKIGDTMGVVTESTLIVTRLRTAKNVEISVPNSLVLSGQVINFSVSGKPFLTTQVTIGYDTPWRQVQAMLLAAAAATKDVEGDPQPFVLQTALDDFYVRYELNFSVSDLARLPAIMSRLHQRIQDEFNERGVQIMSPHFMTNPESPAVVPREKWYAAPATAGEAEAPAAGKP